MGSPERAQSPGGDAPRERVRERALQTWRLPDLPVRAVLEQPGREPASRAYLANPDGSTSLMGSPTLASQSVNGRHTGGRSRTVLLADDDVALRRLMRAILIGQGYEVVEAGSASDALRLSALCDIGLLLTDLRMPGMSGRELAAEVTARKPEIAVLFVSGLIDDDVGRNHPGDRQAFLQKPMTAEALLSAVETMLQS